MRNWNLDCRRQRQKKKKSDSIYISWQPYPHGNIRSWLRQGCIWQLEICFWEICSLKSKSLDFQCAILINVFESCRSSESAGGDLKNFDMLQEISKKYRDSVTVSNPLGLKKLLRDEV